MKPITRYECEHCGKHFATKKYAAKHESKCWANPDLKACRSCLYQKQKWVPVEGKENHVIQDGHICEIDAGDGDNIKNCPSWRYCLDFGGEDHGKAV